MSIDAWLTVAILIATFALLLLTKIPPVAVFLGALTLSVTLGLATLEASLTGFSNPGVITILALYPPLLGLNTLLSFLFPDWPKGILLMLSVLILVPTMTYLIMPWTTKLFRSWLYPKA